MVGTQFFILWFAIKKKRGKLLFVGKHKLFGRYLCQIGTFISVDLRPAK